jgi:hypothetical protein
VQITLRSRVARKCTNLFVQGRGANRASQWTIVDGFEKTGNGSMIRVVLGDENQWYAKGRTFGRGFCRVAAV